jgi:hypothetical protein
MSAVGAGGRPGAGQSTSASAAAPTARRRTELLGTGITVLTKANPYKAWQRRRRGVYLDSAHRSCLRIENFPREKHSPRSTTTVRTRRSRLTPRSLRRLAGSAGFVLRFSREFRRKCSLDAKPAAAAWGQRRSPRRRRCWSAPASGIGRNQNPERSTLLELRATGLSPPARLAAHAEAAASRRRGSPRNRVVKHCEALGSRLGDEQGKRCGIRRRPSLERGVA